MIVREAEGIADGELSGACGVAAGYTDVSDVEGGMIAWEDAGRDLVVADR